MLPFPRTDFTSQFSLVEYYVFFDKPVFFSVEDSQKIKHVVLWVDTIQGKEGFLDTWLVCPVDTKVWQQFRLGEIDTRSTLKAAQDGKVFVLRSTWPENTLEVETQQIANISVDWLPEHGQYVQTEGERSLASRALREQRLIGRINLGISQPDVHEVSMRSLGNVWRYFQDCVDSVVQSRLIQGASVRLPESYASLVQLGVRPAINGSYEAEIVALKPQEGLLSEPLLDEAMMEVTRVLQAGADAERLHDVVQPLRSRFARNYAQLIKNLVSIDSDFTFSWESPSGHHGGLVLTKEETRKIAALVTSMQDVGDKVFTVTGTLDAINWATKRFAIYDGTSDVSYSGKIADITEITEVSRTALYKATLRESSEINSATEEVRFKYLLLNLEKLTEEQKNK